MYGLIVAAGWQIGPLTWVVLITVICAVGVYTATAMEEELGLDPGPVVIDEALGYLVTVAWLPQTLSTAVVAFFLFRFLDIVKPPPARQSERLPGGWGIMADDLIAGVYGNLLIRAAAYGAAAWAAA